MKPLCYVAAPYSKPDPVENTHRAVMACDLLLDEGLVVPVCPHLSMLWHVISPRPYDQWLAYDLELLYRCDAVLRLPGYSTGADGECEAAKRREIPVFFTKPDLYAWEERRRVAFS